MQSARNIRAGDDLAEESSSSTHSRRTVVDSANSQA